MKNKIKMMTLLIYLSISSYYVGKYIDNIVNTNTTYLDDDTDSTKVFCNFSYKERSEFLDDDIITIINDSNEICSIITVDNLIDDTYIYLEKGTYKINSLSGFSDSLTVDDINDIYYINFNYVSLNITTRKIKDKNSFNNSSSLISNSNITNYIGTDVDFNSDTIYSNNLDYSNIIDNGYTPQGYVIIDGDYPAILISSYKKNDNSRIYIYNKTDGMLIGYIILNNKNHVGGITYDKENDILFVTASCGYIDTYSYTTIMKVLENSNLDISVIDLNQNISNNKSVIINNDLNVLQSAATISYYDKSLYSISYGIDSTLVKTDYKVINNEVVLVSNDVTLLDDATCVQGISFYKNNENTYLVCASSAGFLKSKISIYLTNNSYSYKKVAEKIIDYDRIEGISTDKYGNISSIFEGNNTNSKLVGNCKNIIDKELNDRDLLLDLSYNISGMYWDIIYQDDLSVRKSKELIKLQK